MKTEPLGSSLNTIASTSWVKDLSVAPVYVDSVNGDDSNSGLTAAESVATIGKGLEISGGLPSGTNIDCYLHIAGGTYTEAIDIYHKNCIFDFSGNVTINGGISVRERSALFLGGNYTISITSSTSRCIRAVESSHVEFFESVPSVTLTSTGNQSFPVIDILHSTFICRPNTTITANINTNYYCVLAETSSVYFVRSLSISGSSFGGGIKLTNNATLAAGSVTVEAGNSGNVGYCLEIALGSGAYIPTMVAKTSSVAAGCVSVHDHSWLYCSGAVTMRCNNQTKTTLGVGTHSYAVFRNKVTFDCSTQISCGLYCAENSILCLIHSIEALGKFTDEFANVYAGGLIYIPSTATITGGATGKRFHVSYGGIIKTNGAGANFLPGNTAGTINRQITVKDTGNTNQLLSLDYACYA